MRHTWWVASGSVGVCGRGGGAPGLACGSVRAVGLSQVASSSASASCSGSVAVSFHVFLMETQWMAY